MKYCNFSVPLKKAMVKALFSVYNYYIVRAYVAAIACIKRFMDTRLFIFYAVFVLNCSSANRVEKTDTELLRKILKDLKSKMIMSQAKEQ